MEASNNETNWTSEMIYLSQIKDFKKFQRKKTMNLIYFYIQLHLGSCHR